MCNGTRIKRTVTGTIACPLCHGTGKCKFCGGTGKVRKKCPTCAGQGKVLSLKSVKNEYLALLKSSSYKQKSLSQRKGYSLSNAVQDIASECIASLSASSVTNLAVTRIYYNSSGTVPVSKYMQRKILGALLTAAPSGMVIMERRDLQLVAEENRLQWTINGNLAKGFETSQAVLMGEFLWDRSFGQALLSVRILDSTTGRIFAAPVKIVDINPDFAKRLGLSEHEIPIAGFFTPKPSIDQSMAALTKILKIKGGHVSIMPRVALPEKYQFAYRILYCLVASHLVSEGIPVLERELLYQISIEQGLDEHALDTIIIGDSVLSIEVDETTPNTSPTFFTRAVRRENSQTLGQAEISLHTLRQPRSSYSMGQGGVSPLGADDSLVAAVQAFDKAAAVRKEDLIFTSTVKLGTSMQLADSAISLYRTRVIKCFEFTRSGYVNISYRRLLENPVNGQQIFDEYLEKLIPLEDGNEKALKADLTMLLVLGFNGYPGPLNEICSRIISTVTVNHDRSQSTRFWEQCLIDGRDSLARDLFACMHPRYQKELSRRDKHPIDPNTGIFERSPDRRSEPAAKFNYKIAVKWSGKYPSHASVTIDLTPMKNNLYRVNQKSKRGLFSQ